MKIDPLCSVYQMLLHELNVALLVYLKTHFSYLSMLFIFELAITEGKAGQLKDK